MEGFSATALLVAATITGTIMLDVGMNTLQGWYDTFYEDAFWGGRPVNGELDRQLKLEEAEIDRLMRGQDFVSEEAELR